VHSYYPVRFLHGQFRVGLEHIAAALAAEGIGALDIAHDEMCHVHPLFTDRSAPGGQRYGRGALPVAERIAEELLILPLYPDLARADLDDIIAALRKVVQAYRR
jgi:dTDP-4-amino-4,6-dideoxygalactose transaminase